ncbi:hypothetical protein MTO96_049800 [Rhipicephalus appendiculatus]
MALIDGVYPRDRLLFTHSWRTGGGRFGGVEGRVLAIVDRTAPDSAPVRTTAHQGLRRQLLLLPSRCGPPQCHSRSRYCGLLHPCSLQQHRSLPNGPRLCGEAAGHQRHCT